MDQRDRRDIFHAPAAARGSRHQLGDAVIDAKRRPIVRTGEVFCFAGGGIEFLNDRSLRADGRDVLHDEVRRLDSGLLVVTASAWTNEGRNGREPLRPSAFSERDIVVKVFGW